MSKLPDRVAVVGTGIPGGGGVWGIQLCRFLESHGIQVDFIDGSLHTVREFQRRRLDPGATQESVLKRVVQGIASLLRQRGYPAVIATEREDVFLEDLPAGTRRIYFCQASLAYERYYGWLYQGDPEAEAKFQRALAVERSIYQASDAIMFAWNTYESFVRRHVYDGGNIVSHLGLGWYGCEPRRQRVAYQDPLRVAFLGHVAYWSNPALLAALTEGAPFPIHCYGRTHVPVTGIVHRGYVKNEWETLLGYQFGLNSVSTDPHRQSGFSSKVLTYLSMGLPALSPAWQQFSHQVAGVIPYEKETFVELVERHYQPDLWRALSDQAYEQAQELPWGKTLAPLLQFLGS